MNQADVENVLNDPLAQELMASSIPARLAYTGEDERPRVIPIRVSCGTAPTLSSVRCRGRRKCEHWP